MNLLGKKGLLVVTLLAVLTVFALVGCSSSNGNETATEEATESTGSSEPAEEKLSGKIEIDGSSTVFPITEAMAEEFQIANPDVKITVGVSGTGGGMKRFNIGETDISDASRPIKDSEAEIAKENGIEFTRVTVGLDGISVCVNPQNDWAENLTVEQLNQIWKKGNEGIKWSDIDPEWPAEKITLYGPGTDSGTFDYFTENILGEDSVTTNFTPSEDDNVLVQGIAGDKYSLGYFGYAYYIENQDKLKAVSVNGVLPNKDTIASEEYNVLARPLFIYINNASFKNKPQVKSFVSFYLKNAQAIVPSVGYVPLKQEVYDNILSDLEK